MDKPIEIRFNGESKTIHGTTVSSLLAEFRLDGQRVAVELNRRIVPRTEYGVTKLATGDSVEIVQFVGGG